MKWYPFSTDRGYRQKRPPIKKYVLVQLAARPKLGLPNAVAVGYRKDAAGDKSSPYFVVPQVGGRVVAWCDCLPDDFKWPKEATA